MAIEAVKIVGERGRCRSVLLSTAYDVKRIADSSLRLS